MKKIALVLVFLLPLGFYLIFSSLTMENYDKWSDKEFEMCVEYSKVEIHKISIITCSQIRSASYRAFSRATSFFNPIIILLISINFALAVGLFILSNRLEKLEKKND